MIANRLSNNAFERKEPFREPKKIIWLSVEGTVTEINYFNFIEKYKEQIGIDATIRIEPLRKSDTHAGPAAVLELLEECESTMKTTVLEDICELKELVNNLGNEKIKQYLTDKNKLTLDEREIITRTLKDVKYDVEYQKYIKNCNAEEDCFCIVVDTEGKDNPSRKDLYKVIDKCKNKGYKCFISNPCFEFFLLLHTYNPKKEYEENKENFINNPKISKVHTYVSDLLSKKNHHNKTISNTAFQESYLPNIKNALKSSKDWAYTLETVKNDVGSNMIDFFNLVFEKK